MEKKGIVALVLLVAAAPFFAFLFSTSYALAYVSPGKPSGFVNDFANVIPASTRAELEKTLSDFEKRTGNEIVIVTVPSLGGDDEVSYGVKLFEEWGIGKKDKDNGVLILHAPNERRIRIEVGYGLEGELTDAKTSSIYRNIMSPSFKNGDYAVGFTGAVTAIIGTLDGQADAVPVDRSRDNDGGVGIDWFFIIIVIPIWLASILGRSKSWWLGGVIGGILGLAIGIASVSLFVGIVAAIIFAVVGLIFDFIVSKAFASRYKNGEHIPWWIGGGGHGGGFGGGGFGGFGGGGSGGGGGGGGY